MNLPTVRFNPPCRAFRSFAALLALVSLSLACNLPSRQEVEELVPVPTQAPTLAPSPAPPETPTSLPPEEVPAEETAPAGSLPAGPLKIQGAAISQGFDSSGQYACQANAQVTLVVQPGGAAYLSATTPAFFDHINCTPSGAEETWTFEGTADEAASQATFTICNSGGLEGGGVVSYQGGVLSGELSCTQKSGEPAVNLALKP